MTSPYKFCCVIQVSERIKKKRYAKYAKVGNDLYLKPEGLRMNCLN